MNDEVYVIFEGHRQVDYDDYYQCWDEDEDAIRIYSNRGAAIEHLTEWIKRTTKLRPDWTLRECTYEDVPREHSDTIVAKAYKIVSPNEDDEDYCRIEKWNVFNEVIGPS